MGCEGYEPSRSVDDECDESGWENHLMTRCAPSAPEIFCRRLGALRRR